MWNIYGKCYDLSKFALYHPGGENIILKTKNESDITMLFETYHAFSNLEKIREMLDKYEIKNNNENANEIIQYKYDFTTYHLLIKEIKDIFPNRQSIKGTTFFYIINTFSFFIYLTSFYYAFINKNTFILSRCTFSLIAALFYISLGFNIMHNGSHFSISTNEKVNNFLNKIWCSWGLWNDNIWFFHHVYNHHSFTGIENLDPDLYHLKPFGEKVNIDKEKMLKKSKFLQWLIINQQTTIPYFLFIFPGQYVGQSVSYFVSLIKHRIFRINIPKIQYYDLLDILLISLKLFCLWNGLYLPTILYLISLNFWYSINIVADHDTFETAIENHYTGNDWAKIQICHSANFINDNYLWTYFFGSINYQIEHHLFPSMNSIHYLTIKPIVEQFCKKNNIPYVHKNSVYDAFNSFLKMMEYRSKM
jgi:delta11-fatty-acid desaturase